jgi:hypothetical protein
MATIGELYDPAMEITDQAEADAYFERLVNLAMSGGMPRDQAEALQRENLGYWAGYFGPETRDRVLRLFNAPHPFFGTKNPTDDEAIVAGFNRMKVR